MVSDQLPVVVPKLTAVPLAVSVVAQTRPQVGCGPDLPLPVDKGVGSLDDDGLDVIISGRGVHRDYIKCQLWHLWSRISFRLWCPRRL